MKIGLGINLGFAINKYIEPEVWTRVVSEEIGLKKVQFVADLLNPFLPDAYIDSQIERIKGSCERYGISVPSLFTSTFTRINHLLHPDKEAREYWYNWFKRFIDMGRKLGAKNIGSHFGIFTFDAYENKYGELLSEAVMYWRKLTHYAAEKGYECMIFEPMSVPREMANTVAETRKLMELINEDCGIPMKLNLDIGHAPDPSERDPYPWIEQLGADSPIVHIHQTVLNKSNHWPFIKEFNDQGIIHPKKVIDALKRSGAKEADLIFEISHREHHDTDFRIIRDLKESADYWKEALEIEYESGGITRN